MQLDIKKILFKRYVSKAATLNAYLFLFMEIWKDVIGYEGIYKVNNLGRVKSLERKVPNSRGGLRIVRERILKPSVSHSGYYQVGLHKDGIMKVTAIHKIVAMAFLNHIPCGYEMVINHKDFNRKNNNLSNLEIVTQRENTNKKHIKSSSKYIGVSWYKPTKKWKSYIDINGKKLSLGYYDCENEAAKEYERAFKLFELGKEIIVDKRVNSSKYTGVGWAKSHKKWRATIGVNGKQKHLGYFINEIDAHNTYQKALKEII